MIEDTKFLKIAKLIADGFGRSISEKDREYLESWLNESKENQNIYNEIVKEGWYTSNLKIIEKYKAEEGWPKINERIKSKPKKIIPGLFRYAAAAAVVGILATAYFFGNRLFYVPKDDTTIIANENIEPGTDKATLTLEDGSVVTLEKGNNYQTENASSNGEHIVYDNSVNGSKEMVYNYITVPRGGEFYIVLSDSTEIWLNSESQIKFPVNFIEGETRKVELVYGEAYFDVSSSTDNNGSRFIVHNQNQDIEVLGTEFNIKAYQGDTNIYTTLVEGLVTVTPEGGKKQKLLPSQQSVLNANTNFIAVKKVDVYNEISWKDGVFSFEDKTLKEIMAVLSRWYDLEEVVFKNKSIEKELFVGVLSKNRDIEKILSSIRSFGAIQNYTVNGKKVILE